MNLKLFSCGRLPESPLTFLFIARLLTEKGIFEFCKTAIRKAAEVHTRLGHAKKNLVVFSDVNDFARFCSDIEARDRLRGEKGFDGKMPL